MSKNIYDLFNERKNGLDYLIEGFAPGEGEAFESLEEAARALHTISVESTNKIIELQAASYLEDLLIESMMYNDFNESKIQSVMEGSFKEKKDGFVKKIKELWQKIKNWFASAIKTILNHFRSGETLVAKYGKQIPGAMKNCKAKIKMRPFVGPEEVGDYTEDLIDNLKITGKSKEQILSDAGINDGKGIKEKVEAEFYTDKEAKELAISGLNADDVMDWASNKKLFVDMLKKQQKETDAEFKSILSELKSGEGDAAAEKASNFQFGMNLVNSALNTQLKCINAISRACTAVIRKALSGKGVAANDGDNAEKVDAVEPEFKTEGWKILDVDDFEW